MNDWIGKRIDKSVRKEAKRKRKQTNVKSLRVGKKQVYYTSKGIMKFAPSNPQG